MSINNRLLFRISVGLNLLLIIIVTLGYIKINFVKEQVFITEVQQNLIELESLIANQSDNNWSEPNLVTTELAGVLNGIWLGKTIGKQLGTLSNSDSEILNNLFYKLNQYPQNELYRFTDLNYKDIENFEELREKLRNAGLGMNLQVSGDMDYFMKQVEILESSIESPLN